MGGLRGAWAHKERVWLVRGMMVRNDGGRGEVKEPWKGKGGGSWMQSAYGFPATSAL